MKSFILSLASLLFVFGCTQHPKSNIKEVSTTVEITENTTADNLSEASFSISGMTCKMGCAKTIEKNLSKMEGVQQASVDFETSFATVVYNSSILQTDDLVQTVTETGDSYAVSKIALSSNVKPACCAKKGCTKANCAKKKS
jgi:copper chaperone CopZ